MGRARSAALVVWVVARYELILGLGLFATSAAALQTSPATAGLDLHLSAPSSLTAPASETGEPSTVTIYWKVRGIEEPQRQETSVRLPGDTQLAVPVNSFVDLRFEAPGLWAPPTTLFVARAGAERSVTLRPTGTLVATVRPPPGHDPPAALAVRLRSAPDALHPLEAEYDLSCPIAEAELRCEVPSGRLDLRLRARGFVSVHHWGVQVSVHEALDLGAIRLRPGASVVGWVTSAAETFEPSKVFLELEPRALGRASRNDLKRRKALHLQATANDRGFFQFAGVAPGSYELTARHEDLAPARIAPVEVREGVELELPAMDLQPPHTLEVTLRPLRDPFRRPWVLKLYREGSLPHHEEIVTEGGLNGDGVFRATDLEPGRHRLKVLDSQGSVWHAEEIEVSERTTSHEVVLPYDRLEARVTLADEPLIGATVYFGRRSGSQRLIRRTDEEGKIYIFLPRRDSWTADIEHDALHLVTRIEGIVVEREPEEPWAKAEIEVPDTRAFGQVVDEFGQPLPRASVDAIGPASDGRSFSHRVRAEGDEARFEIRGFAPGIWKLEGSARPDLGAPPFFAKEVEVEVEEGSPVGPLLLVAKQEQKVSGRVTGPTGDGVPGALVVVGLEQGADQVTRSVRKIVTSVDGTFEVPVPSRIGAVQLSVFPPGFAARQERIMLPQQAPIEIAVDPVGGTVVLVPSSDEAPESLLHLQTTLFGEYIYYVPFLKIWAGIHGLRQEEGRLVIPSLEPGLYTACAGITDQAFNDGRLPPGLERFCDRGTLVPHGELVLEVPVPTE